MIRHLQRAMAVVLVHATLLGASAVYADSGVTQVASSPEFTLLQNAFSIGGDGLSPAETQK